MPVGMRKNAELFLSFKITDALRFKTLMRQYIVGQVTNASTTVERERIIEARKQGRPASTGLWLGLNLGFTWEGLKQLLGARRPKLDPAFERGAADSATVARLNDPPTGERRPARCGLGARKATSISGLPTASRSPASEG